MRSIFHRPSSNFSFFSHSYYYFSFSAPLFPPPFCFWLLVLCLQHFYLFSISFFSLFISSTIFHFDKINSLLTLSSRLSNAFFHMFGEPFFISHEYPTHVFITMTQQLTFSPSLSFLFAQFFFVHMAPMFATSSSFLFFFFFPLPFFSFPCP